MKRMRKWFTAAIALCLTALLLPTAVLAAAPDSIKVSGVVLESGEYLASGATVPTDAKPAGGYAHYANGTLTLHDFSLVGEGDENNNFILSEGDMDLVLEGTNSLTGTGMRSTLSMRAAT